MKKNMRVHIYAIGTFGESVAHVLRLYIPDLEITYRATMGSIPGHVFSDAAIQVVAVAAPSLAESAAFSRLHHDSSHVSIPITLQSDSIWLGPLMYERCGPCWHCAIRRYLQHRRPSQINAAPPREFPILLPLISSAVWHLARVAQLPSFPVGMTWCMNLSRGELMGQKVLGIHRCPLCGVPRSGSDISTKQMREALSYLYAPYMSV